jgi:hypothetical protein
VCVCSLRMNIEHASISLPWVGLVELCRKGTHWRYPGFR